MCIVHMCIYRSDTYVCIHICVHTYTHISSQLCSSQPHLRQQWNWSSMNVHWSFLFGTIYLIFRNHCINLWYHSKHKLTYSSSLAVWEMLHIGSEWPSNSNSRYVSKRNETICLCKTCIPMFIKSQKNQKKSWVFAIEVNSELWTPSSPIRGLNSSPAWFLCIWFNFLTMQMWEAADDSSSCFATATHVQNFSRCSSRFQALVFPSKLVSCSIWGLDH